jgi:hypothetical protein
MDVTQKGYDHAAERGRSQSIERGHQEWSTRYPVPPQGEDFIGRLSVFEIAERKTAFGLSLELVVHAKIKNIRR